MPEGRNVPKSSIYKFKHWKKIQHEKNQFVFKCYKQKNFIKKNLNIKNPLLHMPKGKTIDCTRQILWMHLGQLKTKQNIHKKGGNRLTACRDQW